MGTATGMRRLLCVCSLAATMATVPSTILAAEPTVRGPESVQDWYDSGQRFLRDAKARPTLPPRAKNVILFVGDGMGVTTVTAARILAGQQAGGPGEEHSLPFERFPNVALAKTYSWDQQTSDSAPTMTAMVTGYKAREGMLSVDHTTARAECDARVIAAKALPTILERAAAAGKSTGVVSTARITHATPAANYAHSSVRDWESDREIRLYEAKVGRAPGSCTLPDIAAQLIDLPATVRSSLAVVLGGGRTFFYPETAIEPERGAPGTRRDGRKLTDEWIATRGGPGRAAYVWRKAEFDAIDPAKTRHLLGLFENSHMQYELDRLSDKGGEPSLTEMTDKAIRIVSRNPRGYYLQVEAGRIDHGHHGGNARRALTDAVELSRAVQRAVEMTDPRETLIIVTADHSHVFTMAGYPHRGNDILGIVRDVPDVDGAPVAPSRDLLGLPFTTLGYQNGPGWRDAAKAGRARPDLSTEDTHGPDFRQEATIPLPSETHGGEDVAIYATGPGAALVHGVMEQHWIFHVMQDAFGFPPPSP